MVIVIHRVNRIADLEKIPTKYGVEIDVRGCGGELYLHHDPIDDPARHDALKDYLQQFNHAFAVLNIKEAGYENKAIKMLEDKGIADYFLLDVEFPYFYKATRRDHFRKLAVRYSEAEPIEFSEAQVIGGKPLADWVWIDTNTTLPLNAETVRRLKPFKTCLVCPERWGRPQDIPAYIEKLKELQFAPDAVMTSLANASVWEDSGL